MGHAVKSVNTKEIPQLALVKDIAAMKDIFQRRLPGFAEGHLRVDSLKVKYFRKKPGKKCQVLYKCRVKDLKTSEEGKQAFFGVIEPNGKSHTVYAKAKRGEYLQPEFGPSLFFLEELNMVLWGFPNDPGLTTISRLVHHHTAYEFFKNHWSAFRLSPGTLLKSVRTKPVKYVPLARCTLRHDLLLQGQGEDRLTLYSKTLNQKKNGAQIFKVMHALWKALSDPSRKFIVPEPFFFEPEMNAIFVRGLEGESIDEHLNEVDLDQICEEVGSGLARLHQCNVTGISQRPDDRIASKLSDARKILGQTHSACQHRVEAIAGALEAKYQDLPTVPQVPTHGAFRISQLLQVNDHIALIDFDEFLLGNPFSDVGGFIGSLLFYSLENKITPEQSRSAIRRFCRAYAEHADWGIPKNVLVWETVANLVGKHAKKCINRPKKRDQNIIDDVLTMAEDILSGKLLLM